MLRFMDAAVRFIAQAIIDGQAGGRLPGVKEVEIVGLAAHGRFVKLISLWRQARGRGHGVGVGCRGEETGKGIGEWISRMDIMLAAGGGNHDGRISGASSEGVEPVGVRSKNRGIAVESQFRAPFEGMRAVRVDHVVFELVDVPVGTEDGPVSGIETFKQTVAEGKGWLSVVAGDEKRRAADVAESRLIAEVWREGARIFYGSIALVIEELHAKIGINRGLVGVGDRSGNLIAAEAQEQGGLIRKAMIEPERSLIRIGHNFGRCGIRARAVCAVRIVRPRIAGEKGRDAAVDRNGQRIAGKSGGVDTLPFRESQHGKYLSSPENLPEALILREIKCRAAAIVDARKEDRAAVG